MFASISAAFRNSFAGITFVKHLLDLQQLLDTFNILYFKCDGFKNWIEALTLSRTCVSMGDEGSRLNE